MADKQGRKAVISKIVTEVKKLLPSKQQEIIIPFIHQLLHLLSYEDVREHSIHDWAGLIVSQWKLTQGRTEDEIRVRVYNPTFEENGWTSPHTVIEISTDDMPFLVDSARMEVNRLALGIHFIVHVGGMRLLRDKKSNVTEILPWGTSRDKGESEAPIHIEIDRNTNLAFLKELEEGLHKVLLDVQAAVQDWPTMCEKVKESIHELEINPPALTNSEVKESLDFLHWLSNNNFTFLGCRDYDLVKRNDANALKMLPKTGLGVLRATSATNKFRKFTDMTQAAIDLMMSPEALIIAKTNTMSTVHRPIFTDYIGVKRFNAKGKLIGERRFVGLFTSSAYSSSAQMIPYFRLKVAKIMQGSGLLKSSHAQKALLNILETLPRNDLFQGDVDELQDIALGVFNMQERNKVRLFMRRDVYGRYFSCYVYIPVYRFTNQLRRVLQDILESNLSGVASEYNTYFSDSILARIHYVVRVDPHVETIYDADKIENEIIVASSSWADNLRTVLLDFYGEELGLSLHNNYVKAFPAGYCEINEAAVAVGDIKHIEQLTEECPIILNLYHPLNAEPHEFNFKIYQLHSTAPLSDVMPILENMGMRVLGEHPFEIKREDSIVVWISDFSMEFNTEAPVSLINIKHNFEQAFSKVWRNELEDDEFNHLILLAQLTWQEVTLLRALAQYIRQMGVPYSQQHIASTFGHYPHLARMLVELFMNRFSPEFSDNSVMIVTSLENKIITALNDVASLDEDKIFRLYLTIIKAILRTNFFQLIEGKNKPYLSIKLDPQKIPELPLPRPAYEIFVYSPRFEGVHLRCGKVARGGLRWSDRREDFRTEVLGLMKAQQVKNSLIVPAGAKGGFYVKRMKDFTTREEQLGEGIACYQSFIRGLLDVSDNYDGKKIIHPDNTIYYDGDDPYLVVAADKGTATFSDIANDISVDNGFWLGDAFASGGKTGYDHKKMGITAKGAWVSVVRHFQNLRVDINKVDFTVVGVGDMSGDVFGNGMLLSKHIRLVAAFNHMHIFIDPNPDAKSSFKERARLFKLPRSSWEDYDTKFISTGGAIFSRHAKSIKLNKQIKEALGIEQDHIVPNDLIKAILKAEVDLLWNGGIGTYVKGADQTDMEVGDRANDVLRINGDQLRCRIVGEGGNLGFTQKARMEFALNGGEMYTDFVDNSAGVDCSDKEVNIKILLDDVVQQKQLTVNARNKLLREMTSEVSELVLYDNYRQTQAIQLARIQAIKQINLYGRFIQILEEKGVMTRDLEALPNSSVLRQRKEQGLGLTTPEISVLVSYSKIFLKARLLESDVPEDPWMQRYLFSAFPKRLQTRYKKQLLNHRLRSELITTQLSNDLVNEMGAVFIFRMYHETGASYADFVKAYAAAREIFSMNGIWLDIQALDHKISPTVQMQMLLLVSKLVRRASRWLIRHYHEDLSIDKLIKRYKPGVDKLFGIVPGIIQGERKEFFLETYDEFIGADVPAELAQKVASCDVMFTAMEVIEGANKTKANANALMEIYLEIGQQLKLSWLRYQIRKQKNETHWEGLALAAIFDDIDSIQRQIALSVIKMKRKGQSMDKQIQVWRDDNQHMLIKWDKLLHNMQTSKSISPVMLFVGLRELNDFAQACSR
jgi:glutamate dehydrogenase